MKLLPAEKLIASRIATNGGIILKIPGITRILDSTLEKLGRVILMLPELLKAIEVSTLPLLTTNK